jgi:hypothetical protein
MSSASQYVVAVRLAWACDRTVRDIDRRVACAFRMLRFAAVLCLLVVMIDS